MTTTRCLCFLDNSGEALAGILRPGRAGSNTVADHVEVLDAALAQIPDEHRRGAPVLVRTDIAGCTHAFLRHIRSLREHGVDVHFSVGVPIDEPIRQEITTLPAGAWYPAIEADGQVCDGAEVAELTGLLYGHGTNLPKGTRFIVRRERPHPSAQSSLFDTIEGYRHQVIATGTPLSDGPLTWIEARHRAHARVEDRIRTGKDSGSGRFPSREYAINQAWLELALTGIDLTCRMRMLLLDGALALTEPKKIRYRLLHVAARITSLNAAGHTPARRHSG